MSIINKAAVLNPLLPIMDNLVDYIPRATTSKFGMVAIGSGINVDSFGRIYLDTQEYSDRLAAIEAEAASTLATQKSEVAAAIAQVNLAQSQTITALTLEVNNLKTNLTNAITTTQTDLINRADQLAQNVTDITDQLALDKAAFTQEIQDALVYLEQAESVASALRTPRKINGTDFDGRSDITTNAWGATRTFKIGNKTNSINGTSNVDYSLADIGAFPEVGGTIQGDVEVTGNLSVDGTISATLEGNAASADKLQTPRTINGVSFDGSADITLPLASTSVSGTVQLDNTLTSTATEHALTAAQGKVLNDSKLAKTENAVSASKLQTSRTISLTGGVTGSISFDGSEDASIATTVTGLGVANGIATLDSSGQVPSTQLPSYVDDVLEYLNVAAFPATGETGKIYVETTGNTTYRWSGSAYVKITSGEVSSVAGKVGVVTLTKSDVGLSNVDNTSDTSKIVASASKLTTARTLSWTGDATGSLSFNGTVDVAAALSLANSGVAAGTYKSVTVDAKGRVTDGNNVVTGLVTSTAATGTTNVATTNTSTFLNITEKVGSATPTVGSSSQITGAGTVTVASDAAGKITITGSQAITGNAATATKLQTARSIAISGAVTGTATSFDGTADIAIETTAIDGSKISTGTIPAARIPTLNQDTTGNAATATKLSTARAINGVSFDGTADITTANWGTSRTLTIGRTEKTVNGSADVAWTVEEILPTGTNGHVLKHNGTSWVSSVDSNTAMSAEDANAGTATTAHVISAAVLKEAIQTHAPVQTSVAGNAATATKLQTARSIGITGSGVSGSVSFDGSGNVNIPLTVTTQASTTNDTTIATTAFVQAVNSADTGSAATALTLKTARTIGGVSFNGSANIDLPGVNTTGNQNTTGNAATATKLQTARTLTIADSGKLVDGSGNVSWTRLDMGVPRATAMTDVGTDNSESCIGYVINTLFGQLDGALYSQVYSNIWKHQIQGDYRTGQIAVRGKNNGTWQAWRTVLDSGNFNNYAVPLTGGSMTGRLTSPSILINKADIKASGISWYSPHYTSWQDYMAQASTSGNGVLGNLTAPVGVLVTSWGKRSVIEPSAGFGWTFETVTSTGTTPTIVAEISNTGASSWSGAMTVAGTITASGNITAFSDARLKDNITKIPDALNKLNQLKGVTYTRKDLATDTQYAGLIAQDVQKVLPEAVLETEGDNLAVDYNGVIGLLVEAIKELEAKVAKLEGK